MLDRPSSSSREEIVSSEAYCLLKPRKKEAFRIYTLQARKKNSTVMTLPLPALFVILTASFSIYHAASGEVIALNDNNINSVLGESDVAIVNFYADWCRFSQILAPTFEEAGNKIKDEFPVPGKVVFAKVDSDTQSGISSRYRISKYPTIKLFRGGKAVKKEYRGQRSVEAIIEFAKEQAKDPVNDIEHMNKLDDLDSKKRRIIGYFDNRQSDNFRIFSRVANVMRDDCIFHSATGVVSANERATGDHINFRPPNTQHQDIVYTGTLTDFDSLHQWASENCMPLVREITFENAEELTEENLPFLILFRHTDDLDTEELFTQEVRNQVLHEKVSVNFLVADGIKFAHPLHHLGKSTSDLPVLAIDSFRHMYLFPHDVKKDLRTPGLLRQFIEDLHSGKLHREFHHGADLNKNPPKVIEAAGDDDQPETKNLPRDSSDELKNPTPEKMTSPPESTFRKLGPSRNRYTILRDEL